MAGAHFPSVGHAAGYADYLCSVYPPECPKIVKSISLESTRLALATGLKGLDLQNDQRRIVSFEIPRAFIDWKPYLKNEPQSQFTLHAALPDIVPFTVWKSVEFQRGMHGSQPDREEKIRLELHKHWLPIELGITYQIDYRQCQESRCFETPVELTLHGERARSFRKRKPLKDRDYERYLPVETPSGVNRNRELLIPKNYAPGQPAYLICDVDRTPTYNWCKVSTMYDRNIILRYDFEAKFLKEFPAIDEKVRHFVRGLIVSDEILKQ